MAIYDDEQDEKDYQGQLDKYGLRRNTDDELEDYRRGASGMSGDTPRDAEMDQAERSEKLGDVQRASRAAKRRYTPEDLANKEREGNSSGPIRLPGGGSKGGEGSGTASKLGSAANAVSAAGAVAAPEAAVISKISKALGRNGTGGRKGIIGLIAAVGFAGVIAIFVWTFLPHHVTALVNFYESKAFRVTIKNLDDSAENMWEHYIRNHVLKALGPGCPNTRHEKSCVPRLSGNDPVSAAINALIGANSEGKFFDRTGILFAQDAQGRLYMTGPGLPDGGIDLQDFADGKESLFSKLPPVTRTQARQALKEALAEQTLFRRAFMRFQLRDIMKKYGIKRCLIRCEPSDNRRDNIRLRKNAFKNYFFQRVLDPRNEGMRPALACLFDPNCDPNKVVDYNGPDGAPRTEFQIQLETLRGELIARGGNEKRLAQIEKRAKNYFDKGGAKFVSELIFGEFVGKKITKAIPVYGWVTTAALIIATLEDSGPKVQGINYNLTKSDMIGTYEMYRSISHEGMAGQVDEASMGSFSESLTTTVKDGNGNRSNAEATQIYEKNLTTPGVAVASLGDPTAYAETTDQGGRYYRCNDGKPVLAGFLICQEESLRRSIAILRDLSDIIPDALAAVASGINTIDNTLFGWATGPIGEFLAHLGKWVGLDELLDDLTRDAVDTVRNYLLPSPVQYPTSGGRNGNLVAGGAYATANEAAHYKLGGQVLTDPQFKDIEQVAIEEEQIRFSMLPLKDKIFEKENPYSLVSRVAMVLPGNLHTSFRDAFAAIIINPFTKIMQGLAHLFTLRSANAGIVPQGNPWGDTTYGWTSTDPIFDTDPAAYWRDNCADGQKTKQWHENAVRNDKTQQMENPTPNGCLLIQATAGSLGAKSQILKEISIERNP